MRIRVLPYKQGSKSARELSDALGARRLRLRGSKFSPRRDDVIINWGSSTRPARLAETDMLNQPEAVGYAANKLTFFRLVGSVAQQYVPQYWESANDIPDEAFPIVCRTVLNGHSGAGIVIAETRDELVKAPLYVKYEEKKQEYRIHVAGGEVIDVQRKARTYKVAAENVNWKIRNHSNGFIFMRQGVEAPESVQIAAKQAVGVLGLDFGAADVIHHPGTGKTFVLEVNTAPGLEGSTIESYKKYFEEAMA